MKKERYRGSRDTNTKIGSQTERKERNHLEFEGGEELKEAIKWRNQTGRKKGKEIMQNWRKKI